MNNLQSDPPYQINDRGEVLFSQSVWRNGAATGISGLIGTSRYHTLALSINNYGTIIGQIDSNDEPMSIRYWTDATAAPLPVVTGNTKAAYMSGDPVYSIPDYGGPRLTDDGYFLASGVAIDSDNTSNSQLGSDLLWKLPSNGQPVSLTSASPNMEYIVGSDLMWGDSILDPGEEFLESKILIGEQLHGRIEEPLNLIRQSLPKGDAILATSSGLFSPSQFYYDGKWTSAGLYAFADDVANDGTAIGNPPVPSNPPQPSILLNGKHTILTKSAPDLPYAWHFSSSFKDISNAGWILLHNFSSTSSAAMLPIRLKGNYVASAEPDTIYAEGAGVDDFSISSDYSHLSGGNGDLIKDRIWISAPIGGSPRYTIWDAPLDPNAKLEISASGALFGGLAKATRQFSGEVVEITAPGASSGDEIPLDLSLGTQEANNTPVWLFAMKERVLKVRVYRITRLYGSNGTLSYVPDEVDTVAMAKHITDIFKPQLNLSVEVTLAPGTVDGAYPVAWDQDGDAVLEVESEVHSTEQELILANQALAQDSSNPANEYDLRVFVIGNDPKIGVGTQAGLGWNVRPEKTVWLKGNGETPKYTWTVAAHEASHIMISSGHPDESEDDKGVAPFFDLPNHQLRKRLMVSGKLLTAESRILTKGEWDMAEDWLAAEIDTPAEQ